MIQIKIRNEEGGITIDTTELKMIIKEYYEQTLF